MGQEPRSQHSFALGPLPPEEGQAQAAEDFQVERQYQQLWGHQQLWAYHKKREHQVLRDYQQLMGYHRPQEHQAMREFQLYSMSTPAHHAEAPHASTAAATWLQAPAKSAAPTHGPTATRPAPEPIAPTMPTSQRQKREAATVTTLSKISRAATPQEEPTNGAILGMVQEMMQQSAQAQTDTHAMLRILHSRADTRGASVQHLADATDERLKDMEERMTNAELAAVADDRMAQTVQNIHDCQGYFKQHMEQQRAQQACFQLELQTRFDKLEQVTQQATRAAAEAKANPDDGAIPNLGRDDGHRRHTSFLEASARLQRLNDHAGCSIISRAKRGARRLLPLGSVRYCPGWLVASSGTLAAPDLGKARRISELRMAWGDTLTTEKFQDRMYATLMKTPRERRHNRRLVAMAKVLQAATLPQQAFTKVQAYTLVCWRTSTVVINAKRVVKPSEGAEDGAILVHDDWHSEDVFGDTTTKIECDLKEAAATA